MTSSTLGFSRRYFLATTAAAAGVAALPGSAFAAPAKAKYTRYSVTSAKGREMLQHYATAVQKLMALPVSDARNWFRNAFVHTMDCPHGNWWFFVWHRGYLGWFEQTLREASGVPDFAIPYWDWTKTPRIPMPAFNGTLDPSNPPYNPFIKDYAAFHDYLKDPIDKVYAGLTAAQKDQLNIRMMPTVESLWKQVKGNETDGAMYATTPNARWISSTNPTLDMRTRKMVAAPMVLSGLKPAEFMKFNSNKTPSHNTQPDKTTVFGILEGNPHNKVHNNIGGVGHITNVLDFGYMADNLSPVDPVFFLHHSNMDRLWDVWTRKQQAQKLPWLPAGADLDTFKNEPFLFYMNAKGQPVGPSIAGDYIDMSKFDYDYEPGFGEEVVVQPNVAVAAASFPGMVKGNVATVSVPAPVVQKSGQLVVMVTVPKPQAGNAAREFDVFVNAKAGAAADEKNPNYLGTISFFGFMKGMDMGDAQFALPLPDNLQAIAANGKLDITVVPVGGVPQVGSPMKGGNTMTTAPHGTSVLKAASVTAW